MLLSVGYGKQLALLDLSPHGEFEGHDEKFTEHGGKEPAIFSVSLFFLSGKRTIY